MKPHDRLRRGDREAWDRETQGLRPLRHTGRSNSVAPPGDAPSDRNNDRRELGQDEAWIEFTRDVVPLGKRSPVEQSGNIPSGEGEGESEAGNSGPAVAMRPPQSSGNAALGTYSLDRRTLDRLRRGRIEPEARLDLHGKRYVDAMRAVSNFLMQRHRLGNRLVLVITGRGGARLVGAARGDDPYAGLDKPEAGVLRRDFPRWIRDGDLANIVIHCQQAHACHGGNGAYYVYLRKRR